MIHKNQNCGQNSWNNSHNSCPYRVSSKERNSPATDSWVSRGQSFGYYQFGRVNLKNEKKRDCNKGNNMKVEFNWNGIKHFVQSIEFSWIHSYEKSAWFQHFLIWTEIFWYVLNHWIKCLYGMKYILLLTKLKLFQQKKTGWKRTKRGNISLQVWL